MTALLASFLFVVLAEMGDKTQLLAMAFATRFPAGTVLGGVLAATLLNHLMAVATGNFLTGFIPFAHLQLMASLSFVLFGLWTLRGDTLDGEDKAFRLSPFWTVAVAFFLAEMGDKTQLATVALAAKYQTLIPVWIGTTAAMLAADAVGITVGVVLGKGIPARFVKWSAALVFIAFGLGGLWDALPAPLARWETALGLLVTVSLSAFLVLRRGKQDPLPGKGEEEAKKGEKGLDKRGEEKSSGGL